jgi:membrane protease subunit HflK
VKTRVVLGAATAATIAYLATGCFVVAPGEQVVVRRCGRVTSRILEPGLHVGLPIGIDRVTRVRSDEVRRLSVGLGDATAAPGTGEFLTGDLNLLRAEATVQYRVADPVAFSLRAPEVEPILRRLAEASLCRALARQGVDATLRDGRAVAAREAEAELARGVERYGLGLAILSVSLTDARPPSEVAEAFAQAQSARSDHDRRVNEAKSYAATTGTKANATARARLEGAHAQADRALMLAKSRASRFLALKAEADKSYALTVRRLYYDTVRELLPKVRRKLVLTPDEAIDLSIFGSER